MTPDLVWISASAPARALLSFILKNPPPSPHDQPRSRGPRRDARRTERERAHWPRQQAKANRARAHPRDSRGSTSASTRVESKRQCFGRDFLAPGSIGDLSEHTGKPCLGAQVDTPTHRCDSHVRRRPALVAAPPPTSLYVRLFACVGHNSLWPYPMATKEAHSAPPKSWALFFKRGEFLKANTTT